MTIDKTCRMCYNFVMEKKYYTVAEFAKKVGVSRATLYRKVEKNLASFCTVENGKTLVSEKALKLFEFSNDTNNTKCDTVTPSINETNMINILCSQLHEKSVQITELNEQLKSKDRQLNAKDDQILRKDEQIEKLQEQNSELTKAFREAQALHAGTIQRELSDVTTVNEKHRWWKFWQKGK